LTYSLRCPYIAAGDDAQAERENDRVAVIMKNTDRNNQQGYNLTNNKQKHAKQFYIINIPNIIKYINDSNKAKDIGIKKIKK